MARNRTVLERTIAEAKVIVAAREKVLGLSPKDKKKLNVDTKWRHLASRVRALTKRLERVTEIETLEAGLVAARLLPKAPKAPKEAKAPAPKAKKK